MYRTWTVFLASTHHCRARGWAGRNYHFLSPGRESNPAYELRWRMLNQILKLIISNLCGYFKRVGWGVCMGAGTFIKVGGHKCTSEKYKTFLWFKLASVTSQVSKYDVITYSPYEGLICKIAPLWKRIGETPEIQIGCYRGGPGHQRHSGSSYDLVWLNKTVRRFRHWNFYFLSFWLALSLLCDVSYVTVNEKFSW